MTDIGIRDISVSFHDNKISNISLVQGDALTRGFDITFVNAKGETLPVDDDYVVELVAVNSKDKDTPYACRHEIVEDKYRVMIPPEALSESGSITIQLVFYQKSTKAVIHTIKQKCPVYQSIGQEFVESNNLYVDITALRLGLEKIEKLDSKYEEIIEKDIEIQANETDRKEAEKQRNLDEVIRKDNESIRNSNEEKREQLKTELIELKNRTESDLESINLTVDDIVSSEDDRKQNEIVREEIKVELENLVADIQNRLDDGDFVGEKGEQGIQGIQGPPGPPGEVTQEEFDNLSQEVTTHKEEYATQRQQDQLKVATVEKELNDYKSTIANVNVNQEAKQSVSGYGNISLPKNSANGQVSISLKGNTVTDENGTKSTISASRLKSVGKNLVKPSHFHINKSLYGNDTNVPFELRDNLSRMAIITPITPNKEYRCSIDSSYKIIRVATSPSSLGIGVVANRDVISPSSTILAQDNERAMMFNVERQDGKTITHDDVINCKFQLEQGTVSTPYEPYAESTSYLPNVGELRSLPNGVRDEIKVSGGKAELVKRVSDTMEELAEPITTPIEVSGTLLSYPSGIVYVEKVLPVAGIYTDEITIAHTDFPISSLDKISKVDFATGVETQLDVSKAVVATDKLSFTHTDLTSGDIVFFEYFYANESTQGELELEYYDSRHVLKDSVTGKFYKIIPAVANGVLTNELLEV